MLSFLQFPLFSAWRRKRSQVKRRTVKRSAIQFESLEERVLLAATNTQIRDALDLPTGVVVSYSGDSSAVQTRALATTGGLLGFPSGRDADFLMVSTGVANQVDTAANTSGSQGTDLGSSGVAGDTATISFSIDVPISSLSQKFKFDFMFLSEEYPEYVGSQFNDLFTATVNGTNVALDQFNNQVSINNVFFSGAAATGTFFDGRTSQLTGSYSVPDGVTTLNVVLSIGDVGDGIYDSAVLLDNFRFETPQVVYLDFDGGSTANVMGAGAVVSQPAFSASDVGSNGTAANVINDIVAGLQTLYADYDISFVTTLPATGDYMNVVIGGDNDATVTMLNPLDIAKFGGVTTTVRTYRGLAANQILFGRAQEIDVGNLNRNDRCVIFSSVFATRYAGESVEMITDRLTITIAHEIGHNLGLRHISNTFNEDVMKKNSPRSATATFGDTLLALAESWGDLATEQNDDVYLTSVLGSSGSGSSLSESFNFNSLYQSFTLTLPFANLFDTVIGVASMGNNDGENVDDDVAPLILKTGNVSGGAVQILIPKYLENPGLFLFGSTTEGGTPNAFTGSATGGDLDPNASILPIYNAQGQLNSQFNFSSGDTGSLKAAGTGTLFENAFSNVEFLPGNKGTFTDSDGDTYTVALTGPGQLAVVQVDTGVAGKGAISQILLQNTDSSSDLTIKVKKSGGDGFVEIGSIEGSQLDVINAKKSDIVGTGVNITGNVQQLLTRDIKAGANISVSGDLQLLSARTVGAGEITAAKIGAIKIAGDKNATTVDFAANVTTTGPATDTSLGAFSVKGTVSGVSIKTQGAIDIVAVQYFVNSSILIGFTPFSNLSPVDGGTFQGNASLGSFKSTGSSKTNPSFVNSSLVASVVKKVLIKSTSAAGANGGNDYGVASKIGSADPSVSIKSPKFNFATQTSESLGDFQVAKI